MFLMDVSKDKKVSIKETPRDTLFHICNVQFAKKKVGSLWWCIPVTLAIGEKKSKGRAK